MGSGETMAGGWTIGTPRARRGSSPVVEVTDGDRQARAWCCFPRRDLDIAPVMPVWLDESGVQLTWQPTHWRPAAVMAVTFEVE